MKLTTKVFVLSCLLLVSCSKSSDDSSMENEQQQVEDFVFTIFNNTVFAPGLTATAYLNDENGQILAQGTFVPEQETSLVSVGTGGMRHDFVLFYEFVDKDGDRTKTVFIFEDIAEGQHQFSEVELPVYNYEPLLLSLYNIDTRPLYVTSRDKIINSPYSGSNGGTIDLSSSFGITTELDGIYLAMRRNVDDFQRYYWDENPPITDPVEMDYNQLPLLDHIVGLSPPAGFDIGTISIKGFTPNNETDFGHEIYRYGFSGYNPSDSYGLPDGLFNRFSIEASYANSNSVYKVIKRANDPFTAIPTSAINLSVNLSSLAGFSATTSGEFDSFRSIYEYENVGTNTVYHVLIFGKKSTTITYNYTNLLSNVVGNELNVFNMEFQGILLQNYGDISGYDDYFREYLFYAGTSIPLGLDYESVYSY